MDDWVEFIIFDTDWENHPNKELLEITLESFPLSVTFDSDYSICEVYQ